MNDFGILTENLQSITITDERPIFLLNNFCLMDTTVTVVLTCHNI